MAQVVAKTAVKVAMDRVRRQPNEAPHAEGSRDPLVYPVRRRTLLGLAAGSGATVAAGLLARPAPARADDASAALAGVWGVEFRRYDTPAAQPGNRVPLLFTQDGGVVIGFRPSTTAANDARTYISSGVGQWMRADEQDYVWAYTGYTWNDQNALVNTFSFRIQMTLADGAETLNGTFKGGPMDLDGNSIGGSVEGTITGRRLWTLA
jgi:hypothetical protein